MVQNLRAYLNNVAAFSCCCSELISYFMLSQSNVESVCRKRLNFLVCYKDQS